MMHYDSMVVTLVDNTKKPLREHEPKKTDDGRRCKVFIPFDSEYQFLVKNTTDRRLKLDIHIDGTLVSGSGLVITAHSNDYIDRFVDIAEKFKYVRKGHADVADPTNAENGIIKVRVVKEKLPVYIPPVINKTIVEEHHHHHYDPYYWNRPFNGTIWHGIQPYGGIVGDASYSSDKITLGSAPKMSYVESDYSLNMPVDNPSIGSVNCFFSSCSASVPSLIPEVGATIGGSKSDQIFNQTFWNGDDGAATYFTFHTLGVASIMDEIERLERETLEKLKAKYENK